MKRDKKGKKEMPEAKGLRIILLDNSKIMQITSLHNSENTTYGERQKFVQKPSITVTNHSLQRYYHISHCFPVLTSKLKRMRPNK